MATGNQVTLTFAGDSSKLEKAFSNVGSAADGMSRKVKESADSFDRVGESADTVDTRAMGFRDTLTGIQDSALGMKRVLNGDIGFESLLLLGAGVGDLGSAFYNFLIPSMKSAVTWLKATKVGTIATAIAQKTAAAATKVWAAAQWVLDAAMSANPIGLIIIGIIALIAVIVLIATKTTWFQDAWNWAWGGIKAGAEAVWGWISGTLWPGIKGVWDRIVAGVVWVKDSFVNAFTTLRNFGMGVIDALLNIPNRLRSAFGGIFDIVSGPFRAAFNFISRAWNNTIGRLSWSVPGWVPFIGGNSIHAPQLPTFHKGGVVPGAPGTEVIAKLQAGERVTPAGQGGGAIVIELRGDSSAMSQALILLLSKAIRDRGGNVQAVLGR